jgi:hypothetical protein
MTQNKNKDKVDFKKILLNIELIAKKNRSSYNFLQVSNERKYVF